MAKIKDSGSRSEFETGAHRDNAAGKGRMDLLPFWAMMELSKVFEEGAMKYRANNWRRGIPLSRYVDSGLRHMSKWMAGWRDEPHLVQAAWNFMCLIETQMMIEQGLLPETLNDLPYNPLDVKDNPNDVPPLALGDEGEELDKVGRPGAVCTKEEIDKAWDDCITHIKAQAKAPSEGVSFRGKELFIGDEKVADITHIEIVEGEDGDTIMEQTYPEGCGDGCEKPACDCEACPGLDGVDTQQDIRFTFEDVEKPDSFKKLEASLRRSYLERVAAAAGVAGAAAAQREKDRQGMYRSEERQESR